MDLKSMSIWELIKLDTQINIEVFSRTGLMLVLLILLFILVANLMDTK